MSEREWPRLSKTLRGPVAPDYCQSCGRHVNDCIKDLRRWVEYDQFPKDTFDKSNPTVLVLCDECSDKLIEKHPRQYDDLHQHAPNPGSMNMCLECHHRFGLRCMMAKPNGGVGVVLTFPKPHTAHIQTMRNGGGRSGFFMTVYSGPVISCSERLPYPENEEIPLINSAGQRVFDPGYSTEPDDEEAFALRAP